MFFFFLLFCVSLEFIYLEKRGGEGGIRKIFKLFPLRLDFFRMPFNFVF